MEKRIVEQIKKVKIYIPPYYIDGGMGFRGDWTTEEVFYDDEYTTPEDIEKK